MMAPPDVKKQRLLTEKLDVTKNRFTASKIPSDLDVIIVGSGMSPAYLQMFLYRIYDTIYFIWKHSFEISRLFFF